MILGLFNFLHRKKKQIPYVVERGEFKNDLAFLEYIIQFELANLTRNIEILQQKEKVNVNVNLINDEMLNTALENSIMTIINKMSDNYKQLLYFYFKDENALIEHIVTTLYAISIEKVVQYNKDKINRKRYEDAIKVLNKRASEKTNNTRQSKEVSQHSQAEELPSEENIEIPEVL